MLLVAAGFLLVGDDSQMKGDCTAIAFIFTESVVGDDSQMKGDCTSLLLLSNRR